MDVSVSSVRNTLLSNKEQDSNPLLPIRLARSLIPLQLLLAHHMSYIYCTNLPKHLITNSSLQNLSGVEVPAHVALGSMAVLHDAGDDHQHRGVDKSHVRPHPDVS